MKSPLRTKLRYGIAAVVIALSLAVGSRYYFEGYPKYKAGTCLVSYEQKLGVFVEAASAETYKYVLFSQNGNFESELSVRQFNVIMRRAHFIEVDCQTGAAK